MQRLAIQPETEYGDLLPGKLNVSDKTFMCAACKRVLPDRFSSFCDDCGNQVYYCLNCVFIFDSRLLVCLKHYNSRS
jgi:hypothetical protein